MMKFWQDFNLSEFTGFGHILRNIVRHFNRLILNPLRSPCWFSLARDSFSTILSQRPLMRRQRNECCCCWVGTRHVSMEDVIGVHRRKSWYVKGKPGLPRSDYWPWTDHCQADLCSWATFFREEMLGLRENLIKLARTSAWRFDLEGPFNKGDDDVVLDHIYETYILSCFGIYMWQIYIYIYI